MVTLKYIERLRRMDQLIRQQCTGNSDEFAERMGVSRRQLYNLIEELKDFGLPISFNRSSRTFFYINNCKLEINIEIKELDRTDYLIYNGGFIHEFQLCNYNIIIHTLCLNQHRSIKLG
jgi:transcriptional antiterminator